MNVVLCEICNKLNDFMKKLLLLSLLIVAPKITSSQNSGEIAAGVAGLAAITFLSINSSTKETAKRITQFRAKEYIMNEIIGQAGQKEIRFETESLASDNSAGLISVAFNCEPVNERGLLLAFFGDVRNDLGVLSPAYAFKYLPLEKARALLTRIAEIKQRHDDYLVDDWGVNNVFVEGEDMRFILYKDGGYTQIRVFWNGFEVEWEETAFKRTMRRLDKWFDV